ncbi:MAG: hypothetical protein Q4Q07_00325 [Tissierellia bacterium]|nr:hypothetical protein [Tissierellia bacterium]
MPKLSIRRGRLPIYLFVLAVFIYLLKNFYEPMIYVAMFVVLLAVISYWRSCRCPICNAWLKIWEVQQEEIYTCPHCSNKIEVTK